MTSRDHPGMVCGSDGWLPIDPIAGPLPGYKAMERTAKTAKQQTEALNETPAEQAMSEVKAVLDKALANQKAALETEAQRERSKLQRELDATHTFVKTLVTVERVSSDGLTRRVEHRWEAPNIETKYHLDTPCNFYGYGYGYPGTTITITLYNPTDALTRVKAGHGGR